MKPTDKAIEAARAEGKRWQEGLNRPENQIPCWKVLREADDGYDGYDVIAKFNSREERDKALERLRAEAMLTAAYAAQFQSEDFAGLLRELRMRPHRRGYETEDEAKERRQKEREEAADALEAVLAERDALKSELIDYKDAAASEADFVNEQAEKIRELKAERDALAARLAPVEDEALVERDALKKAVEAEQSMTKLRLGPFLKKVRQEKQMTLRAVEEATDKEISNAYLSQLESGKIANPSPHVLYTLSLVFGVAYETLMERAGYIMPAPNRLTPSDNDCIEIGEGIKVEGAKFVTHENISMLANGRFYIDTSKYARLAPVDDEALVEIVAKHFIKENKKSPYTCWKKAARDAIAAVRPHIEAAERERCAQKILETNWVDADPEEIAAAIRSSK